MSYSSVFTSTSANDAIAKNVISANVGGQILKTSASAGGNLPVAPATLVSGTTYTFCSIPFPFGVGTYAVDINFDITGDNTTAFSYIKTTNYIGAIGGTILSDNTILVGATLPDASVISINYPIILQLSPSAVNSTFSIAFTATFAGTAPVITSPYLRFIKVN